ncbi:hypothetical protein [Persephonella sp.]
MKRLITAVVCAAVLATETVAGSLTEISDQQLDNIYAQGFFTEQLVNSQVPDGFTIGDNTYYMNVGDITIDGGLQLNLDSSLLLSGNAQQNAFIPINVVDSAVNIPINIVVIMGDNNGSINISNLLESINKSVIGQ